MQNPFPLSISRCFLEEQQEVHICRARRMALEVTVLATEKQ